MDSYYMSNKANIQYVIISVEYCHLNIKLRESVWMCACVYVVYFNWKCLFNNINYIAVYKVI